MRMVPPHQTYFSSKAPAQTSLWLTTPATSLRSATLLSPTATGLDSQLLPLVSSLMMLPGTMSLSLLGTCFSPLTTLGILVRAVLPAPEPATLVLVWWLVVQLRLPPTLSTFRRLAQSRPAPAVI